MALFEILFILAGFFVGLVSRGGMFLFLLPLAVAAFVLAIMNRPRTTGSRAKKIVSSILSAAYLAAVLVFLIFIHFKSGPNDSVETPPRNAPEVTSHNDTELDLHKCIAANSDEIRVKGGFYTHTKEYCPDIRWKFWDVPKEERLNPKIDYGTLTDARDGHKYKTVQIGNQFPI